MVKTQNSLPDQGELWRHFIMAANKLQIFVPPFLQLDPITLYRCKSINIMIQALKRT